jgi:CRP-like cAMP-binding protein
MPDALQVKLVHFPKDAYVIVEGKLETADRFFIIAEGQIFISRQVEITDEEGGGLLGRGDFFGVIAAMSRRPHIETARALTDCVLISVTSEQFVPFLEINTSTAMKIIQQFSRRMRCLDTALAEHTFNTPAETDSLKQIFGTAEYYMRQGLFDIASYAYRRYLEAGPPEPEAETARERLVKISRYLREGLQDGTGGGGETVFDRDYSKNTMIFCEGESGDELFIIKKGTVRISKIVEKNEVLISMLREGDIFGEMALLESKPRTASAITPDGVSLMAVNRGNFYALTASQPQLVARLVTMLAGRIWFAYRQLANTRIRDPQGRIWDTLLIHLMRANVSLSAHAPYTFDFGPKELMDMVGLSRSGSSNLLQKIFEQRNVFVSNGQIAVTDVMEIVRQAGFAVKIERLEAGRRTQAARSTTRP